MWYAPARYSSCSVATGYAPLEKCSKVWTCHPGAGENSMTVPSSMVMCEERSCIACNMMVNVENNIYASYAHIVVISVLGNFVAVH